jgi:hypothetical protein
VRFAWLADVVYTQSYFQKEILIAEQRLSNTVESIPPRAWLPGSLTRADGSNEIDKVERLDVNQIRWAPFVRCPRCGGSGGQGYRATKDSST